MFTHAAKQYNLKFKILFEQVHANGRAQLVANNSHTRNFIFPFL
jgi:hypothetical protein